MSFGRPDSSTDDTEHPTGWTCLDPFRDHLDHLWDVPRFVVAVEEAGRVLREEAIHASRGRLRDLPIGVPVGTQTMDRLRCTIATQTEVNYLNTCKASTQADPAEDLVQFDAYGIPVFDDRGYGKAGRIEPLGEDFRRRNYPLPNSAVRENNLGSI
ncbi:hypothetical protein KPH14_012019 [Odynerus spinipes]|uniref:Uncharacterized protein n=1 Tax=Odynerus spinipes TaxID=1348599 RepID=A0AAD9RFG7_9HYME|nr:hypothetical protein KPH14_012019 [Odynerus spinipes]